MDGNFEQLINALSIIPLSIDTLQKITFLIKQQTSETITLFITESLQSLLALKEWIWQRFSHDCFKWIKQSDYITLFNTLALFNKNLIFNYENIESDVKASLLIPNTIDEINIIFQQINQSKNDNDLFIIIVSSWFDNLSSFLREYPDYGTSPILCHINQYIARNYIMTDQFKFYIKQLQQSNLLPSIFTDKQLFYISTCSYSVYSYLSAYTHNFIFTPEEFLLHFGNEYLQIILMHTQTIEKWNNKFLNCISHLTGFILSCYWWCEDKSARVKILFPTEQTMYDFIQVLIRIISYEPFQEKLKTEQLNDETIFLTIGLKFLLTLLQTQNVTDFVRTDLTLPNTLFKLAELSTYHVISLNVYAILGEILSDEKLKELTVVDQVDNFFYSILEQAWHHPLKKYKQLPIVLLLRSFVALSKSDAIQQGVADSNRLGGFIEMSDQYPVVFDIIWALSFNHDIQQQLRSNPSFIQKLSQLAKESDDEQVRKTTQGILWNLEINHQDRSISSNTNQNTF
ncbi:unnamed protein product, partial [Adineta steineri]